MKFLLSLSLFLVSLESFANTESLKALSRMYYEFEINAMIQTKKDPFYQKILMEIPNHEEALKNRIDFAKDIHQSILKYERGELTANQLLNSLFQKRFELLHTRFLSHEKDKEIRLQKIRKENHTNIINFIPTDPNEIKSIQKYSDLFNKSTAHGIWNLTVSKEATDRYQLLNSLIREIYREIAPQKLTEKNQLWLRCSVSIHPFLSGSTEDSGFPDRACIPSSKPGYFSNDTDDYSLCSFYVIPTHIYQLPEQTLGAKNYNKTVQAQCSSDYDIIEFFWKRGSRTI